MNFLANKPLRQGLAIFVLLCAAAFLTCKAYSPGLGGSYVFDDYPNIVANPSLGMTHLDAQQLKEAATSSGSGPMGRPISMLSFAANRSLTGANPYYFKITNLGIHIANGLSIYLLSLLLLRAHIKRMAYALSDWQLHLVSVACAAAWMLHPINLTSVLYVVQRMNSLSAFFSIWGLILFVWGRARLCEGRGGYLHLLAGLIIFTPLSVLSKESGALLPLFMLAIELSLFQFKAPSVGGRRFVAAFFSITVAIPGLCVLAYLASHWSWLSGSFLGRNFTLSERLMTEARVMWFYLREIVLPNPVDMGLFHDDIAISHSLLQPASTLPAIAGLAALLATAVFSLKRAPLLAFGLLFFFAGHVLESTVFPLEIAFEHRNYLPMYGILLPLFFYLLYPLKHAGSLRARQAVALLFVLLLGVLTWSRAGHWATPFDLAKIEVDNHPNSARDNGEMGNNYISITTADEKVNEAYYWTARHYYEQSAVVDPDYTNGLVALLLISYRQNKPVDPAWVPELKRRLEHSPIGADLAGNLKLLIDCQARGRCKLENQVLRGLIDAALRNPTLNVPKRGQLLSCLSMYLVNVEHDYPKGLEVMAQIVDNDPQEVGSRLELVQYLIAMHKPEEARAQLAQIRSLDRKNEFGAQIAALEQQLSKP